MRACCTSSLLAFYYRRLHAQLSADSVDSLRHHADIRGTEQRFDRSL